MLLRKELGTVIVAATVIYQKGNRKHIISGTKMFHRHILRIKGA